MSLYIPCTYSSKAITLHMQTPTQKYPASNLAIARLCVNSQLRQIYVLTVIIDDILADISTDVGNKRIRRLPNQNLPYLAFGKTQKRAEATTAVLLRIAN
jgi:hypothetical protein